MKYILCSIDRLFKVADYCSMNESGTRSKPDLCPITSAFRSGCQAHGSRPLGTFNARAEIISVLVIPLSQLHHARVLSQLL